MCQPLFIRKIRSSFLRVKNVFKYKELRAIIKKWYQKILFLLEPGHKRGDTQTGFYNSKNEQWMWRKGKNIKAQKDKGKRKEENKVMKQNVCKGNYIFIHSHI